MFPMVSLSFINQNCGFVQILYAHKRFIHDNCNFVSTVLPIFWKHANIMRNMFLFPSSHANWLVPQQCSICKNENLRFCRGVKNDQKFVGFQADGLGMEKKERVMSGGVGMSGLERQVAFNAFAFAILHKSDQIRSSKASAYANSAPYLAP
jgi:hypothetical protein